MICTSGNAVKIVQAAPRDKDILFVPDENLGAWVMEQTGRPMTLWQGNCYAHVEFRREQVLKLREKYPDAKVVVHPESLREVRDLADAVCSTERMISWCKTSPAKRFVVVTESGIIHRMQKECPGKEFLCAPVFDVMRLPSDHCRCSECKYMKLNTLEKVRNCMKQLAPRVELPADILSAPGCRLSGCSIFRQSRWEMRDDPTPEGHHKLPGKKKSLKFCRRCKFRGYGDGGHQAGIFARRACGARIWRPIRCRNSMRGLRMPRLGSRWRKIGIALYKLWHALLGHSPVDVNAMVLATVDQSGRPSTRAVLLKGVDESGFYLLYKPRQPQGTGAGRKPQCGADVLLAGIGAAGVCRQARSKNFTRRIGGISQIASAWQPARRHGRRIT